jgi:S1-C subfamily serine protease
MAPIAVVLAATLAAAMPDEAGKATEMEKSLRTASRDPIASERRQAQQRAAASVWLVVMSVRLEGEFEKIDDNELVGTDIVTTVEYWGSSVAVSADGYLLTNRHVADARYLVACACLEKKKKYGAMRTRTARIDFAFVDFAGEAVPGRANVYPGGDASDLCDDPMSSVWSNADDYPARIVALDELSDLALVQLGLADIPFIEPTAATPAQGDPVAGLGYDGRNQRLVRLAGLFVSHCADAADEPEAKDDDVVFLPQPMPMMESTVPVRRGMSGGPLVTATMAFVGINTLSDVECEDDEPCPTENAQSFAVPGPYAVAWFRWVTGASPDRPALCSVGGHRIELFDPFGSAKHR